MNNIKEILSNTTPRERSGSQAFNRFSFQNSWALCHLLSLHDQGIDYLLLFDFHDDVAEISNSASVKFYQIKTNATIAAWKPKNLIEAKKGKFSYIGKLYHHYINLNVGVDKLLFVSNIPLDANLDEGGTSKTMQNVEFKKLHKDIQASFVNSVKIEHKLSSEPDLSNLCFRVSPISLHDSRMHALGEVVTFLTKTLKERLIPADPFYLTLSNEIERRASWEFQPSDWNELCKNKGLSRSDVETFIKSATYISPCASISSLYLPELEKCGMNFLERESIRKELNAVERDLLDNSNLIINEEVNEINNKLKILPKEATSLIEIITYIYEHIKNRRFLSTKTKAYLYALTMVVIHEKSQND